MSSSICAELCAMTSAISPCADLLHPGQGRQEVYAFVERLDRLIDHMVDMPELHQTQDEPRQLPLALDSTTVPAVSHGAALRVWTIRQRRSDG